MKRITTFLIAFLTTCTLAFAQEIDRQVAQFKNNTSAIVSVNDNIGTPSFIRFLPNKKPVLRGSTVIDKAQDFLNRYKGIYGLQSIEKSLKHSVTTTDNYGFKSVVFKQSHEGVPVFDGELRFHFNGNNNLSAINGNVFPDIGITTDVNISPEDAAAMAEALIDEQQLNKSGRELFINSNTLYVFPKGLVRGGLISYHLVYEVEISNDADVREFLFIDAHSGKLVQQFTGIAHALDRVLYDGNTSNTTWSEGDAFPGTLDQFEQNILAASEHTYNFFKNAFGYISYNNADAQMRSIDNYEVFINANRCPNASWNGVTTNYCPDTAADDVVAHEWGHAYTQFTSGLIYAYQSGALNEAFSDIWGETIDLINNYEDSDEDLSLRTVCGSSDRWRMGEDATSFASPIRDMWNPTCNGHPGKVSDTQFWCGSGDSGGVHINSGVPNHAYALLVDGGSFNGETITSIGFTKAAHIFWRAQSTYLTPSSDFADFADALEAACVDLTGINLEGLSTSGPAGPSGEIITPADLIEVTDAINAVELRADISESCPPLLGPTDPLCEAATSNPVFLENWESGLGNWTLEQLPSNPGTWTSRDWVLDNTLPDARSGTGIFAIDPIIGNCASDLENGVIRLQSPIINIPDISSGTFEMGFDHYVVTEGSWDGGNIKYSIDGGSWTLLPSAAFTDNPYNSILNSVGQGNDNPMAGEAAYTGADGGTGGGTWGTSIIDLSSIGVVANSALQLRWEFGTDGCNGVDGWYLDDIVIYNCSQPLSIADSDAISNYIKVYPNPSSGVFTLRKTAILDLETATIHDLNGRVVKQINLSDTVIERQLDLSKLSSGVYFMKILSSEGSGVFRLIKE